MKNDLKKKDKTYPKGHFVRMGMAIGIAIFSALGIAISFLTENFALIGTGPAIGVATGLAIGQSLESKYEKEGRIRPLNESDKKKQKIGIGVLIGLLIIGVLVFLLLLLKK